MSIENILGKIEKENRERVNRIIGGAESRAEEIEKDYRREVEQLREKLKKKFRGKADEHRRQIIVSEQLEQRKKLLGEKRRILEDFYSDARDRIRSMSGDEYAAFIRKLILERAVTGNEEIVIPSGHEDVFTDSFIESLNKEFGGENGFSVSSERGDFSWGFILREKDRKIDLSLERFFRELVDDIEAEAARILFSDSGAEGGG